VIGLGGFIIGAFFGGNAIASYDGSVASNRAMEQGTLTLPPPGISGEGKSIAPGATSPAWDGAALRDPHAVADKARRVRQMFTAIAPSYDLNNRLHSLWIDQHWRHVAVNMAELKPDDVVVDVACGTGDLALLMSRRLAELRRPELPRPGQVMGIDFTYAMLPLARAKAGAGVVAGGSCVRWFGGDAQALPLSDASADVLSIAFGIRNVADVRAALREFYRVLRPGGRLIILEFSLPRQAWLRGIYNFYFRHVLPRTATLLSGDKSGAYRYLPQSVNTFIEPERMKELLSEIGFVDVQMRVMTFGICVCYRAIKRVEN
jgi:demethylmenaquinone methyltransferase/2-methoxy-6-polyprenyl-1,4-benzoquinol methylase